MRRSLPSSLSLLVAVAFPAVFAATADASPPGVSVFGGASRGGDAQLHPALSHVACDRCTFVTRTTPMEQPSLASLGASIVGQSGAIRGGVEAFSLLARTSADTSGYAGLVTFIGTGTRHVYAVAGVGLGSYYGGDHSGVYAALSGSTRLEVGVHLPRGFALVGRVDSLKNEISTSRVATLGLSLRTR